MIRFCHAASIKLASSHSIYCLTCPGTPDILLILFGPLQATFIFFLVRWTPLTLGKGLVAPMWATTLGWLLTLSSVSLLPIWAIYALVTTPGTLPQVITPPFLLIMG